MRVTRPVAAATTALALAGGTVAAVPALASQPAAPVTGTATSALSLLGVTVAGQHLSAGVLSALTSTLTTAASQVSIVPVTVAGSRVGAVTVTSGQSRQISARTVAVPGLASVTSPAFAVTAATPATGPTASVGSTSLGALELLGLPVRFSGKLQIDSSTTTDAVAGKTLQISDLSLPSLAAILATLGLNVAALPTSALSNLAAALHLGSAALTAAQEALAAAAAAVPSAPTSLAGATALVTSATSTVTSDTATVTSDTATVTSDAATVTSTTSGLQAALDAVPTTALTLAGLSATPTAAQYLLLPPATQAILAVPVPALTSDAAALLSAQGALTVAQTALTAAKGALAAAQAALTVAQALLTAITNLGTAVDGLLGNTPLVKIGSADVTTLADAGPHLAAQVSGTVSGVSVLGQNVLSTLTGSSTLNITSLLGTGSTVLASAISQATGALSQVLSAVPGLSVPAPQVSLLQVSKGTSTSGKTTSAHADVTVLSVTVPSLTIPTPLSLPAGLPAVGAVVTARATTLSSPSLSVVVGNLTDQATATPVSAAVSPAAPVPAAPAAAAPAAPAAAATTPTATAATLPFTGLNSAVPLTAVGLLGAGLGLFQLRRRRTAALPAADHRVG